MGSLIEEVERLEAAAQERVEQLRMEIAELTELLSAAEERLVRLRITRETVDEILGDPTSEPQEAAETDEGQVSAAAEEENRSPIGVVTVPAWRPGLDVSVLPVAYRDILEVLADAGGPMRAKQISIALGRGEGASKVESLRVKLKRLVERDWLSEDSPGLFALVSRAKIPGG
ncbi:hypothetical protein [Streptomyces mirabilis]